MPDVQAKAHDDMTGVPGAADSGPADDKSSIPAAEELARAPTQQGTTAAQRNPIFSELVQREEDLPGLVGYALYKLSKRDWLTAFVKIHGRDPTEDEIDSYILGERTQRRVATYRRLAEELISRKAAVVEKPAPALPPASSTQEPSTHRITPVKGNSLRSSLANEVPSAGDARRAAENERPRRSGATTLIFWLLVLVVLVGVAWVYFNYPSLLHTLTG
ncbi:MAG: hypothetical protein JO172_01490 [Hyphomicrobiales bacterium]|nr:hypothetical protein [Hyphomicrobiales bacterium]